jgi:hypothetical protein
MVSNQTPAFKSAEQDFQSRHALPAGLTNVYLVAIEVLKTIDKENYTGIYGRLPIILLYAQYYIFYLIKKEKNPYEDFSLD